MVYLKISVLSRQFSQSRSGARNVWIDIVEFPWQLTHPPQDGKHSCFNQLNLEDIFFEDERFYILKEMYRNNMNQLVVCI